MKLVLLILAALIAAVSVNAISFTGCGQSLSQAHGTYTLSSDINNFNQTDGGCPTGGVYCQYCIRNPANDTTIDCNGYTINFNSSYATTRNHFFLWNADYATHANFTFRNCNFDGRNNPNLGVSGKSVYALYGANSQGVKFINSNFTNAQAVEGLDGRTAANITFDMVHFYNGSRMAWNIQFQDVLIMDSVFSPNISWAAGSVSFLRGKIINNYFNDTHMFQQSFTNTSFNDTHDNGQFVTTNSNIIGGRYYCGNYYADGGNGYSEICDDVDVNGICDNVPYAPVGGTSYDYCPLTSVVSTANPYGCYNLTGDGTVDTSCIFRDTFNYNSPITGIGWHVRPGYESTQPSSGMLACGNTPNYYWLPTYPLTASKGAFVVNMSVALCPITGGEFYMAFGSGSTTSFYLSFEDGGAVKVSDPTLGDQTIGSFNTNCSNLANVQNVSVVVHPEYSPKTFTVWVNGTYLGTGQFTQDGQALDGMTWALWQGNILPNYCSWYMDSVSAFLVNGPTLNTGNYTCSYDSVSGVETCTNGTIANSTTQMLGKDCFPSESPADCFRRVKGCLAGENINVCEARVAGGGALSSLGGWIVSNFFLALILVVVIVGGLVITYRAKNPR